jgi:hypothetical protein
MQHYRTRQIISTLAGTTTHEANIVLYQAHRDAGTGFCERCGRRHPCPARRNSTEVIHAAGDDPRRYDEPPAKPRDPPPGPPGAGPPAQQEYEGYAAGGHNRPPSDEHGYLYDRSRP